ncbi:UDP-N-acetylmuramate--L-alanine ligase [Pedobacter yulinensis]|uniref:UDP-N-acetylmuramate--L-alanine ligase n=1 Tax=Pedobacter yulinensis TaxID=2126353 RepID=A0A2T3HHH8_9SPHI|nr:UDP-N-acetylmuramate--L-alanine ligase [Pedobacter yulinensis]PST81898.1 UDP-N-acetylmuramate--L-alanine ligase [Pedobacter yulinensis]
MELEKIKRAYFVGIGGIGMSALARYFSKRGVRVCGYDKTRTRLTETLAEEGIAITYQDLETEIPADFHRAGPEVLVVYTPAIPKDAAILNFFLQGGFALNKRSQVLGIISLGMTCIAVAGTHGKTTTSSVIAHILQDSLYGCTAFLGGIAANYNSNVLYGNNNVVVVEADEYDRSFLTLHPDLAVITSMDADHLDIYGDAGSLEESFRLFAGQVKTGGRLFVRAGLPVQGNTYAVEQPADVQATNIRVEDGTFVFDYRDNQGTIEGVASRLPGRHNIENATAAIAVARQLGISAEKIRTALGNFKGVRRRFEYQVVRPDCVYVDDYAHHPEELRACFSALRELYPDRKLTVVFQPHLFTRTRDFAAGFAQVLSTVDDLLLLDVYPARELPIAGVTSAMLLDLVSGPEKALVAKEAVTTVIGQKKPALLVTVGAGDIDTLVEPLKKLLDHA